MSWNVQRASDRCVTIQMLMVVVREWDDETMELTW